MTQTWSIFANNLYCGTVKATVDEIEAEFGSEGRDWYRRRHTPNGSEVVVVRRPKRSK